MDKWYESPYGGYYEPDYPQNNTHEVFEQEPEYTGIQDVNGDPIYKPKTRIGFI